MESDNSIMNKESTSFHQVSDEDSGGDLHIGLR